MDKYAEDEYERRQYYSDLMHGIKDRALKKFVCISRNTCIQHKFANMLIDSECESCSHSEYFISYFGITELEKTAILEDLEAFILEYKEWKESEEDYES
jgi:hypothetical protein